MYWLPVVPGEHEVRPYKNRVMHKHSHQSRRGEVRLARATVGRRQHDDLPD